MPDYFKWLVSVLSFLILPLSVGVTLVSLFFVLSKSVGLLSAVSLPWQAKRKLNPNTTNIFFIT